MQRGLVRRYFTMCCSIILTLSLIHISLYRVVQQLEQNGVIKREGRVIQLMEEPDISREKRK